MIGFEEVAPGVYLKNGRLPDMPVIEPRSLPDLSPSKKIFNSIEASGQYLTASDFGQAGVEAGKTENYGQGVMCDIALEMVGIDSGKQWLLRGTPERNLFDKVFYTMKNPDLIKKGSRNRLLLGTQLVHDVWSAGEGITPADRLPQLGKVGHRVVSMLFMEEIRAKAFAEQDI